MSVVQVLASEVRQGKTKDGKDYRMVTAQCFLPEQGKVGELVLPKTVSEPLERGDYEIRYTPHVSFDGKVNASVVAVTRINRAQPKA